MHTKHRLRSMATALAGVMLLSACATNPDGSLAFDPKITSVLIGAAAGCAVGSATSSKSGQGCLVGAAIGAAAGYLVGWYFESKKLADAKTINRDYENQVKAGKIGKDYRPPKNEVVPVKFETKMTHPSNNAANKNEFQVTSNTDLIGYGDRVPEVHQNYAIYDEKNQLLEERTEKMTAVDGAGRYQTQSKFSLPADAKGKQYTVKTSLVANNKPFKESSYKVSVLGDDAPMLIVALHEPRD